MALPPVAGTRLRVAARRVWGGVAVPPATVVPLGLALVLEGVRPWPRTWPVRHVPVGVLLVAAGVAVNGWASVTARGRVDDPGELRSTGPYAVSRHPMYVGWHLVHLGVVVAGRSTWSLLGLVAGLAVGHRTVLAEEVELIERFGEAYAAYSDEVPRYLAFRRAGSGGAAAHGGAAAGGG